MNTAYLAAALAGIIGLTSVAAFTPESSLFAARPHASIAAHSGATISIRSPLPLLPRNEKRSLSILGSSLAETFETEAANNETRIGDPRILLSGEASSVTSANGNDTDINIPPQQLQQVLSSPELVDPAAIIFDVAISVTGNTSGVVVDFLASDAAVTSEVSSSITTSNEEDLELTRRAIMKHAEQIYNGDVVEEDGEDDLDSPLFFETTDDLVQGLDLIESGLSSNLLEQPPTTKKSTLINAPSIKKILRYTIPAIGIWLCSPVLSMIDTAAVGLLSGTAQQAALNPAVSVTDQGALVLAFMYTATTNLIAAAVQEDNDAALDTTTNNAAASINIPQPQPRTTTTLITALKLALFVGTIFGALLGTSAEFLLKLLIGNDSLDPIVFSAALRYVRIRALGMPAMAVIGTAQSACLGMQDVKSPLYVLAAAAVVNFFVDVLLVPRASSMFGGAAGAAWATVFSQYAALLFFARWLTTSGNVSKGDDGATKMNFFWNKKNDGSNDKDVNVVNVTQGIMDLTGTSKEGKSRRKEFRKLLSRKIRLTSKFESPENLPIIGTPTVTPGTSNNNKRIRPKKQPPKIRGFLSKLTLRNYLSLSNLNKSAAREFRPFVIPVTTTSIGRISGYIAMSHVASSTLGTYDMAAHQIIFSIFCCLTPFVDALNQVAQSFVPAVFEAKEKSHERAMALRKTTSNFRKVGVGFGAVLVFLASCIPLISSYFTTDLIVLERVNGAIPGVGLFLALNGLMCAGEGTMLGQKDLKFLRNMYAVFFFAVPACMLRLKYRALAGVQAVGVGTMWATFSAYQVIRTSIWHLRLWQLQRRTEREVVEDTRQQ